MLTWWISCIPLAWVLLPWQDELWLCSAGWGHSTADGQPTVCGTRGEEFHILLLISKPNSACWSCSDEWSGGVLTLQSICAICDPTSVCWAESLLWQSKEKMFKSYFLFEPVGNVLVLGKIHQVQREYKRKKEIYLNKEHIDHHMKYKDQHSRLHFGPKLFIWVCFGLTFFFSFAVSQTIFTNFLFMANFFLIE